MEIIELQQLTHSIQVKEEIGKWKRYVFKRGEKNLPKRLLDIIDKNYEIAQKHGGTHVFEYANMWYKDAIYYKGDPNATSDWIFMTNGGGYYTYGSKRCIWETRTWIDRTKVLYSSDAVAELGLEKLYLSCPIGSIERAFEDMANYSFRIN